MFVASGYVINKDNGTAKNGFEIITMGLVKHQRQKKHAVAAVRVLAVGVQRNLLVSLLIIDRGHRVIRQFALQHYRFFLRCITD